MIRPCKFSCHHAWGSWYYDFENGIWWRDCERRGPRGGVCNTGQHRFKKPQRRYVIGSRFSGV